MIRLHAVRLHPGDDLRQKVTEFTATENITAGTIASGVGHLTSLVVRLANATPDHQPQLKHQANFEIVSLTGTLGSGGVHLHIAAADENGRVVGGHLQAGCIVGVTVELVILADDTQRFSRHPDPQTGFDELIISQP